MRRSLMVMVAALIVAACSQSSQNDLIGTWDDLDEDVTAQFFEGGTVIIENDGDKLRGRYAILDEESLRLDLSPEAGSEPVSIAVSFKLSGDRLVLTTPDGESATMVRTDR